MTPGFNSRTSSVCRVRSVCPLMVVTGGAAVHVDDIEKVMGVIREIHKTGLQKKADKPAGADDDIFVNHQRLIFPRIMRQHRKRENSVWSPPADAFFSVFPTDL